MNVDFLLGSCFLALEEILRDLWVSLTRWLLGNYRIFWTIRCSPPNLGGKWGCVHVAYLARWRLGGGVVERVFFSYSKT